ncbi:MAG TPA: cytochrome D1 domain-containing protein [Puia sp.]|nr:cytochrome D1 domain-containing protein [Puia sp.]
MNKTWSQTDKTKSVFIRLLIANIFLIIFICSSFPSFAQATPPRSLLALSKADHVLAIIDPVSLKIIAKVPVGSDPHEVIASSDGKTAWVTIYGGGSLHELNVIDLIAQKPLPNIDTRPLFGPHGLTFVDGKVWFTAEGSKAFGRYDPATGQLDWCMGTGQDRTHMIYVTPDGKTVYTTNVSSGTVSIVADTLLPPPTGPNGQPFPGAKARMEWIQTVVPVSKGSEGFDVSPNGRELWTAASDDGTIAIIDLAAKRVSAKLDAKAIGANRLKFTPDGKQVLISSLRNGDLIIYDAASRKELKRLNIGHGGAGILIDTDGSRAFIGCTPDNYVAIVDLKTLTVAGHIDLAGPDGLAWAIR